jgi:redox-sensitive bicupin YhaK (pirin superfamily)
VRRAIPQIACRHVGPFVFVDHMGPVDVPAGSGLDVRPHPHVGLATITYLFDGDLVHRDSLGTVRTITPGSVNYMTAGRGIVHSERSSAESRERGARMHGMQTWVALPAADEDMEPAFDHHDASDIPRVERDGAKLTIIAGDAYGARSPVNVRSKTLYVHAELSPSATLAVDPDHEERAVYVVSGEVTLYGETHVAGTLVVLPPGDAVLTASASGAHAMLFGGDKLDGPRILYWNFVATSQERIDRAKQRWSADDFGSVPGDTERIPLP